MLRLVDWPIRVCFVLDTFPARVLLVGKRCCARGGLKTPLVRVSKRGQSRALFASDNQPGVSPPLQEKQNDLLSELR